jgi:hypothetical protein
LKAQLIETGRSHIILLPKIALTSRYLLEIILSKKMEGTSGKKSSQKKQWRFPIEMDGLIKRPYNPSIEMVTRPGEELPKGYTAPARLSVLLRSQTELCYGVMGLRIPVGVERKGSSPLHACQLFEAPLIVAIFFRDHLSLGRGRADLHPGSPLHRPGAR